MILVFRQDSAWPRWTWQAEETNKKEKAKEKKNTSSAVKKKKKRVKRENTLRPESASAAGAAQQEAESASVRRSNDQLEVWFKQRELIPVGAIRCLRCRGCSCFFAQSVPVSSRGAVETAGFGTVGALSGLSR